MAEVKTVTVKSVLGKPLVKVEMTDGKQGKVIWISQRQEMVYSGLTEEEWQAVREIACKEGQWISYPAIKATEQPNERPTTRRYPRTTYYNGRGEDVREDIADNHIAGRQFYTEAEW